MLNILILVDEIFTGKIKSIKTNKVLPEISEEKSDTQKKESDEQTDTTDTPELETEQSAAERRNRQGKGLKILTPDQMLSRLPTTLAQLKAGNTAEATVVFFAPFKKIKEINLQPFNQRCLKMKTIFMNTENSKTNEPHRFRLSLANTINLKNRNKNIAFGNLSIYCTWKNIKSAYNNNKFKISAPTWNDTFDFPDGCYSIADIQYSFKFIIKKLETLTENPPVQIYSNKIKNRIVFKINTGYKLE